MAKTSHLSHVIITQTTKPQAACARNLGARARKTEPGLKSPEKSTQERVARVRACNSGNFETVGIVELYVLKIVTHTACRHKPLLLSMFYF